MTGADRPERGPARGGAHLLAWLALGLALRGLRVIARWDELTLAYAAYAEPVAEAIERGQLLRAATTWVGLHPPLHPLLMGCSELLAPVPLLWLAGSAALSLSAVALAGRVGGPLAAAVLATSPLQLADAAEVNNYPLATFALALVLATARAPWPALALVATVACWSHVLAGAGAAGVVLWRAVQPGPAGARGRLLLACALGAAPVVVGGLRRAGEPGTFTQGAGELGDWLAMVASALGVEGLLLAPLVALGLLWLRGPALAAFAPVALVLGLALWTGAAAPHQRPYLGLLGPPAAVAVGQLVGRLPGRGVRLAFAAVVLVLCGGRAARWLPAQVEDLAAIRADLGRERALDRALALAAPGDSLWVVVPALQPDDDKSATGPLMWRLPPWTPMPVARPVAFEYGDYRYGQPRAFRGLTVHTSTELSEVALDHVASAALARGRIFVILADHGPAAGLRARVERALRPYAPAAQEVGQDLGLGTDLLYVIDGPPPTEGR
ncbi:hypothetical protein L6R53_30945 [Myxococcota bacterium]|nr:hypothetical protein [Myxococcota bacterium]